MRRRPTRDPGTIRFAATLQPPERGGASWVAFPYELKELYGVSDLVPVVVTIERLGFRSTIFRRGWFFQRGRPAIIPIARRTWRRLRRQVGERVMVTVTLNEIRRGARE